MSPWPASVIEYLHLCEVDAVIIQFKPAFIDRPEIWMQYYVAIVGYDEGVTIHAKLIRQRKLADVVDWHVCASHAEQRVIRCMCHVVAIVLAIEHRRTHRSQQPVFLPGGSIQGGRVLLNVLILV